ncbi:hypothetical protein DFH08DRAFT_717880, partial [Mycena albidolilacea]
QIRTATITGEYPLQTVAGLVFITQELSTVQFYRLSGEGHIFYTASTTERDNAIAAGYTLYTSEPPVYIYSTQIYGSVPFYHLYNAATQDNFYTISESERLDFITH